MCGFLVFLFRKKQPKTLIILGVLSLAVASLLSIVAQFSMPYWPEEQLAGMAKFWAPAQDQVAAELAAYRGSWGAQNEFRFMMASRCRPGPSCSMSPGGPAG